MPKLVLGFLLLVGMHLTGCATMARGSHVDMVVATEPQGALVTTDLETKQSVKARQDNPDLKPVYHGCPATPCEFEMSRRAEFIMTLSHPGYAPVEIGVDHSLHKQSMNANLAGAGATGAVAAVGVGALGASIASAGLASSGAALGAAALSAAAVTGGVAVLSLGVDASTGALQNLNPNPVFVGLPEEGTEFEPDPKVELIRQKRREKAAKTGQAAS